MDISSPTITKLKGLSLPVVPMDVDPKLRVFLDDLIRTLTEVLGMFSSEGIKSTFKDEEFVQACPSTEPDDGLLVPNSVVFWVDEVGNDLTIKVKYSSGTVKTATVALA